VNYIITNHYYFNYITILLLHDEYPIYSYTERWARKKKCTKIDQQEERRRIIKGRHLGLWEAVLSTPELNLYVQFFILLNNVFNEQPWAARPLCDRQTIRMAAYITHTCIHCIYNIKFIRHRTRRPFLASRPEIWRRYYRREKLGRDTSKCF